MTTIFIESEGGVGFEIETIWAYVAVHADGDEGIVAMSMNGTMMPLIAADKERLDSLEPYVKKAAAVCPHPIKLVRFDRRTDLETIN